MSEGRFITYRADIVIGNSPYMEMMVCGMENGEAEGIGCVVGERCEKVCRMLVGEDTEALTVRR